MTARSRQESEFPGSAAPGMRITFLEQSPKGALRLLLRLPNYLYRARLGWLLDHRFLMLSTGGARAALCAMLCWRCCV